MTGDLAGRVVVVSGADRSPGADVAAWVAARGAHVVCVAGTPGERRSGGAVAAAVARIRAAGGEVTAAPATVSDAQVLQFARSAYGPVDALVNTGTGGSLGAVDSWQTMCQAFLLSTLVLEDMLSRAAGRIVTVTAPVSGRGLGPVHRALCEQHVVSILGFTRELARQVQGRGVGVGTVARSATQPGDSVARAVGALLTGPLGEVHGQLLDGRQLLPEAVSVPATGWPLRESADARRAPSPGHGDRPAPRPRNWRPSDPCPARGT